LTARIERGLVQETYILNLWSPPIYHPDVSAKELKINAIVPKRKDLARCDRFAGQPAEWVQLIYAGWKTVLAGAAKWDSPIRSVRSKKLPDDRFNIVATLSEGGKMTLAIDDEKPVSGHAAALFAKPFDPEEIRLGRDLRDGEPGGRLCRKCKAARLAGRQKYIAFEPGCERPK
jgi:hypothetical protein